jgi:pimeloyl-ACP methyl ester carboxylesterase
LSCFQAINHPTLRADLPLFSLPALPVFGGLIRHTAGPLLGAAIMPLIVKRMFSPLPVPERFDTGFPRGLAVRPWQIRAEAQDTATMVPAVAAMQESYRDLQVPVVIMAGVEDRIVDPRRHAIVLHRKIPQSTIRLFAGVGHMVHYAAPEEVADTIGTIANRLTPVHAASIGTPA